MKKVDVAYFDCCVVNSIYKLPLDRYDVVIADEPVVTVGNFYMDFESHGGPAEKPGKYTPIDYSYMYCVLVRRAKRVFFVDAAFSKNVMDLCAAMYLAGTRKATISEVEDELGDVLPNRPAKKAAALDSYVVNTSDKEDTKIKRVSAIKKWVVVDSSFERPIFEKLTEYYYWQTLVDTLVQSGYTEEKSIVYFSVAATARRVMAYIRANPPDDPEFRAPKMALVTSETIKNDGRRGTIKDMEDAQIALVTSGLGIGSSFPLPNMFDRAFAFIEYKDHTPHMDDMVQLCARVRTTTNRTLCYTVRVGTGNPTTNLVVMPEERNRYLLRAGDTADDVSRLLGKAYYDRKDQHRAHCTFIKLARDTTREALERGFSYSRDNSLNFIRPEYELIMTHPYMGAPWRMNRTRKMLKIVDSELPNNLLHLSEKNPRKLARGNTMVKDFEGVEMSKKAKMVDVRYTEGGITPVLMRRKKRILEDDDEDEEEDETASAAKKMAVE